MKSVFIPSILVLDDEESVCRLLSTILSHHGYDVKSAKSGKEALRMSLSHSWDAVITDGHLGEMDGANFASLLRQRTPWTPVILISGFANEYRENPDFVAVFPKPFKIEDLLAVLGRVISAGAMNRTGRSWTFSRSKAGKHFQSVSL